MAPVRTPKPPPDKAGAPRWTYALGAAVGALALGWTIVSHFIPRAEPQKASSAAREVPLAASVSVGGSNNTVIGVVTGGSVDIGTPAKPGPPGVAASATAPRP